MPRDSRPYVTYPLNYSEHPRLEGLTDAAFRVFHNMNDYSRVHNLDGTIPVATAKKRWPAKALDELVAGAPGTDRPLVILSDDGYFLRSYAEHQFTTADIEDLRTKRSLAGSMGGKAKAAAKRAGSNGVASATDSSKQNVAESESRSELQTDVTYDIESGQVPDRETSGLDSENDVIRQRAQRARIGNLIEVRGYLAKAVGQPINASQAVVLVEAIVSKAKRPVDDVDAYVATTCRRTALEVQQAFFDLDVEGLAS